MSEGIKNHYSDHMYEINSEVNLMIDLHYPSLLNFVGYSPVNFKSEPYPVIVMENASNGSLRRMIEIESKNRSDSIFNDTKKLINIFGIASFLSYLHSKDIIFCNLDLSKIFLDDFMFPKIALLDETRKLSDNPIRCLPKNEWDRLVYLKDDTYKSPEVNMCYMYSSAGDVFAFGMIAYAIATNKLPYFYEKNFNRDSYEENLPKFNEYTPKCYMNLIEKCWSFDPAERPTFDDIAYQLKTNPEFITEKIDKEEYQNYIKYIEANQSNEITKDSYHETQEFTFHKVKIDFSKLRDLTRMNFSVSIGSIDLNSFEKNAKIGSGSFGVAYKITEKETEKTYAAKVSKYEIDQCTEDITMNLSREISIFSTLNHPSILRFDGYCPTNFKHKPKPVIITEFAENGSLDKILEKERKGLGNYEWDDTKRLINIYGIASGMSYLHKNKILHRDLKPGNIFLDGNLYPKIADFGLSKNLSEQNLFDDEYEKKNSPISSGFKGTYAYCSPEILEHQEYTEKGDVYAFAMIVYEIMTNEIPFEGFNQYSLFWEVTQNNYRPKFNISIPYAYRKLIESCWDEYAYERPEFIEIVDMLENNQDFITQNVNEEEFLNYVSYVKEYQQNAVIKNIPQTMKKPDQKPKKVQDQLKIIEEEEATKTNACFIDLNKFERLDITNKEDTYKIYKIREKETGNLFSAQISMNKIHQLSKEDEDMISKEIDIISQINHPSILKFIGFSPIDFKKERKPVIIMEISSNGTLSQVLELERNDNAIPTWDDTKKLINIYGVASGMSHLHSKNIIHRCLKPSNIYLDDALFPKIGDFGLSSRFYSADLMTHQSISGTKATPIYSAPEILQFNEFSKKSDVYAFAFIVYEILMKEIPFNDIKNSNKIFDEVVIKNKRPPIKDEIPQIYRDLIERCWSQDPNERPTFDEIIYNLRNNHEFITSKIRQGDYLKYIEIIDSKTKQISDEMITNKNIKINDNESPQSSLNSKIAEYDFIEENCKEIELERINEENNIENNDSLSIEEYISSNRAKELMEHLNDNCDEDYISFAFDQCWKRSKDFYINLCKEGILINNPIAHHKYAVSLIFDSNNYVEAKHHLEESIKQGYALSYFMHARLCYSIFNEINTSFISAQEGAKRNEKYSKCLLGYFIAHGIGTEKDFQKGVEIMLNSNAANYYEKFATDYGIYYFHTKNEEDKAFYWFEKAYNMNKTTATINNYGICLMEGIGTNKNIDKAEEVFIDGMNKYDANSMYHLGFIREKTKPDESIELYRKAAKRGHAPAQVKYASILSKTKSDESLEFIKPSANNCDSYPEDLSIKYLKKAEVQGNIKAREILAKKYSKENDTENTYKYMQSLIKTGNFSVPIEYVLNCYNQKQFTIAYEYFSLISDFNHPIAKYFVGLMKYKGQGCAQNESESLEIMKFLSSNGIEKATEFLENNFK